MGDPMRVDDLTAGISIHHSGRSMLVWVKCMLGLMLFWMLSSNCSNMPRLEISTGDCNPTKLLRDNPLYKDSPIIQTGHYSNLLKLFQDNNGEELGCLISRWDNGENSIDTTRQDGDFFTMVAVNAEGKLRTIPDKQATDTTQQSDSNSGHPFLKLPKEGNPKNISLRLFFVHPEYRNRHRETCLIMQVSGYNCFGADGSRCSFYIDLFLTDPEQKLQTLPSKNGSTCQICTPEICDGKDNNCDNKIDTGDICGKDKHCCKGKCADLSLDPQNCGACDTKCRSNEGCSNGHCCPSNQQWCGPTDKCIDVSSDTQNCGACGNKCKESEYCHHGQCCPQGSEWCVETKECADLNSSVNHCGKCGNKCPSGHLCLSGNCCPVGYEWCKSSQSCVDLKTDPKHCGKCDNPCELGNLCDQGHCCPSSQRWCLARDDVKETCANLQTEAQHCGACHNRCAETQACCDGKCTNISSDNTHCGSCNRACKYPQICIDSSCKCPPAKPNLCDQDCVDIKNDGKHCGQCNNACPVGEKCNKGQCVLDCPSEAVVCGAVCCYIEQQDKKFACCDDSCEPIYNNTAHCGSCNNKCGKSEICCTDKCINPQNNALNCGQCGHSCNVGEICSYGHCCPSSTVWCDTPQRCIDTSADIRNCGACNHRCSSNQTCEKGRCVCPAGLIECGPLCINIQDDPMHCGGCYKACISGQGCHNGRCECPTHHIICDAKCTDVKNDPQNCGKCNNGCRDSERCVDGLCLLTCPQDTEVCGPICCPKKDFACCNDVCLLIQTDPQNCGSCGNSCPSVQICNNGKCVCPIGQTFCNGQCVNTQVDPKHCGKCDTSCVDIQICQAGACKCPSRLEICNGKCLDLQTDAQHCGKCDNKCAANQVCSGGKCISNCPAGTKACGLSCCPNTQGCCNDTCIDNNTNYNHCGQCGNSCSGSQTCCEGKCADLQSDANYCGSCLRACSGAEPVCSRGHCCSTNRTWCEDSKRCFNLNDDKDNCGRCGRKCGLVQSCRSGKCCTWFFVWICD